MEFLLWGGCFDEVVFVLGVHGDDVVELFYVGFRVELAGALLCDVDVVEGGGLDGAGVWGVAGVVGGGAAGVYFVVFGEVVLVDEVLEDALG